MMNFLAMGGYGQFVWAAYAASALGLAAATVLTLSAYFRVVRQLSQLPREGEKPLA